MADVESKFRCLYHLAAQASECGFDCGVIELLALGGCNLSSLRGDRDFALAYLVDCVDEELGLLLPTTTADLEFYTAMTRCLGRISSGIKSAT